MTLQRLKEKEILLIAEQVLIGEKKREDFEFLSADNKSNLDAILYRGIAGIAHLNHAVVASDVAEVEIEYPFHRRMRRSVEKIKQHQSENEKDKAEMLYALTKCIAFTLFPLKLIFSESMIVRRKLLEVFHRHFSVQELATLLFPYSEEEKDSLISVVSPKLANEIQFHLTKTSQEEPPQNFDLIATRYSIITANFLNECSEVSKPLLQYTQQYLTQLQQDLVVYCQKLPVRFGLVQKLKDYTPQQWTKLAGLTARRDMAMLSQILPDNLWKRLAAPLPSAQREEVAQLQKFYQEQQQKTLIAFVEVIDVFRYWMGLVDKVQKM